MGGDRVPSGQREPYRAPAPRAIRAICSCRGSIARFLGGRGDAPDLRQDREPLLPRPSELGRPAHRDRKPRPPTSPGTRAAEQCLTKGPAATAPSWPGAASGPCRLSGFRGRLPRLALGCLERVQVSDCPAERCLNGRSHDPALLTAGAATPWMEAHSANCGPGRQSRRGLPSDALGASAAGKAELRVRASPVRTACVRPRASTQTQHPAPQPPPFGEAHEQSPESTHPLHTPMIPEVDEIELFPAASMTPWRS